MARPKDPQLERLWRRRLERQSSSGLSIAAFCVREGLSEASFHSWKRRLRAEEDLGYRTHNHYVQAIDSFCK
jgi:hypothetical protein